MIINSIQREMRGKCYPRKNWSVVAFFFVVLLLFFVDVLFSVVVGLNGVPFSSLSSWFSFSLFFIRIMNWLQNEV